VSSAPVVVTAPDKFKGSLSAQQVTAGLAKRVLSERPEAECVVVPMADGGDGSDAAGSYVRASKGLYISH